MDQKTKLKNALFFLGVFCILILEIIFSKSCVLISDFAKQIYVSKIIDGDTFKDNTNKTYRILGIDTPETFDSKNEFKPTTGIRYYYGNLAKEYLCNLISNQYVEIEVVKKDKYNRLVSKIQTKDKNDVGCLLVKNGLAIVRYISENKKSPFYYYNNSYINELNNYQNNAQKSKNGIWLEIDRMNEIYPN